MPKYYCKNCCSFKTITITSKQLPDISKYKMMKAFKEGTIPSLGLAFPLTPTVYKRIIKHDGCKILYCTENRLPRELYIDRDNSTEISCGEEPCPKYKPVHVKS